MAHRNRAGSDAALPMVIDSGPQGLDQSRHNPLAAASQYTDRPNDATAAAPDGKPLEPEDKEAYITIAGIVPPGLLGAVWEAAQKYAQRRIEAYATRHRAEYDPETTMEDRITKKVTTAVTAAIATVLGTSNSNSGRPTQSFASIVAETRRTTTTPTNGPNERPTRSRVEREVTVRTRDAPPDILNRTPSETVQAVNLARGGADVIAARKLPSGDTVLTYATAEAARSNDTNWVALAFNDNITLSTPTFAVIAKGIRAGSVPNDTSRLINEINNANNITILYAKVIQGKPRRPGTAPRSSLILRAASIKDANYLCDSGLLFNAELHDCEPYNESLRPTQCFNCYRFGHISRNCTTPAVCGRCGGAAHDVPKGPNYNNCPAERNEIPHSCILCNGDHPAWSRDCPVSGTHWQRAKEGYLSRPTRFRDQSYGNRPSSSPDPLRTLLALSTANQLQPQKRRAGRPLGSTNKPATPNASNKQRRISFSTAPIRNRAVSDLSPRQPPPQRSQNTDIEFAHTQTPTPSQW